VEILMIAANTNPGKSGAKGYVADLKTELAITEAQSQAWAAFTSTLLANSRRIQRIYGKVHPFGVIEDRLAALASMRTAAAVLFTVLGESQQRAALQLLPLCCIPRRSRDAL
jgi:hypothetical protein